MNRQISEWYLWPNNVSVKNTFVPSIFIHRNKEYYFIVTCLSINYYYGYIFLQNVGWDQSRVSKYYNFISLLNFRTVQKTLSIYKIIYYFLQL